MKKEQGNAQFKQETEGSKKNKKTNRNIQS